VTLESADFPDLSDHFIEDQAHGLLESFYSKFNQPVTAPVPTELIAEQFLGYSLDIVNDGLFSDPNYLGGIVFEDQVIQISESVESHEGRYNFTIAHEIGHHVLHRDFYYAHADTLDSTVICREAQSKPKIEQQADRFAAALLMPRQHVLDAIDTIDSGLPAHPGSLGAARGIAHEVIQAGAFSNVSNTAMVNRLIDLKLILDVPYQTGVSQTFFRRNAQGKRSVRSMTSWTLKKLLYFLKPYK